MAGIPIGKMRGTAKVSCTICGKSHSRKMEVLIYENTQEAKDIAVSELEKRANKEHTCRVCKSIKGAFII